MLALCFQQLCRAYQVLTAPAQHTIGHMFAALFSYMAVVAHVEHITIAQGGPVADTHSTCYPHAGRLQPAM